MIKKYNRISLALGAPGIILQIGSHGLLRASDVEAAALSMAALGVIVMLVGTALLIVGLAYYAKAKGRSPAWCLMAFLSLIGLIVLAALKDKSAADDSKTTGNDDQFYS